ncbi:MAG: hypothetical protein ACP5G7_00840 [Anaerolineae bacterium]
MDPTIAPDHPQREMQAIAAALVALMVAVAPLAQIPSWEFSASFLGSELTLEIGANLLGPALAAGLVGSAVLGASLPAGTRGLRALLGLAAHWALPMVWAVAMWEIAPSFATSLTRAAFAIGTGVGLVLLMRLSEPRARMSRDRPSSVLEDLATYVGLLAILTGLHAAHLRSAISATAIAVLGALAALGLFFPLGITPWRTLAASLTVGGLLGQFTWALNYCAVGSVTAGGLLLLAFYVMVGMLRHALRDDLKSQQVVEYLLVCCAGVVLIVLRVRFGGA